MSSCYFSETQAAPGLRRIVAEKRAYPQNRIATPAILSILLEIINLHKALRVNLLKYYMWFHKFAQAGGNKMSHGKVNNGPFSQAIVLVEN